MTAGRTRSRAGAPRTASATVPAATGVAACCTVHLLVVAGVLGGLSGLAIGGIAVGVGAAVAAGGWLVAVLLARRRARAARGSERRDECTGYSTGYPASGWRSRLRSIRSRPSLN